MKWAERVRHLEPELLAEAARVHAGVGGLQSLGTNPNVPQIVRDALNVMQMAFADVIGTDGHRRLCRHGHVRSSSHIHDSESCRHETNASDDSAGPRGALGWY